MVKKFFFFFVVLFLAITIASVQSVYPTFNDDVLGLIVFKAGLTDPNSKLTSWTEESNDPCHWIGVECDPTTNRVSKLVLDGFSLSGHIGRGLLRLQLLRSLSLANNNFTGTINPNLPQLGSLQVVDFSGNRLSGRVPKEFFEQCGSLRSVSFANNKLKGQLPDSLSWCSTLVYVNFSANQLSGNLPEGIWGLKMLQSLDFSRNSLDGEIPDGIGGLYDLRTLDLSKNRFSGTLPGGIGACSLLKSLDFSENYFSGNLPDSMNKLVSCSSISLGGNSLTGEIPEWVGDISSLEVLVLSGNNFSGGIPVSIGNLQFLKELNLSNNKLTGGLPDSMSNCDNLVTLDASKNLLTGTVPSWIFEMGLESVSLSANLIGVAFYEGLQVLDLSSNSFSGEISFNIRVLSNLLVLNMSNNQIFGPIPTGVGELKTMQVLDLSHNFFNGSIPSEIGGAISLRELRFQNNFLSGNIPSGITNCSALTTLNLSQNNLSGQVPSAIANLSDLHEVDLSQNDLSGTLPKELGNLSRLESFNISHNRIEGELPVGGFFNTIPLSAVSDNPSLCGSVVNHSCPSVHPKPIVLNPNSSDSTSGSSLSRHGSKKLVLSISALIAIGAAAFIALGVVAITFLNIHARSAKSCPAAALALSDEADEFSCTPSNDPNYGKLVMFSGDADFVSGGQPLLNQECELGRGGFGVVYQTNLRDGRSVAIKKLTVSSLMKLQEDFDREVKKLGSVAHENVVTLEGYYWTPSLQLLIYEFVPNGNLYKQLYNKDTPNSFSWRQRFDVILGMAKGLSHLHRMNIIHYNLKSTNILIDSSGEAKVGDFGLASLLPTLDRCILSSKIQSALGYMAPEFACRTVNITEKCDVYGFGVLVLEVVTGKKPVEYMEDDVVVLTDMVRGALEDGKVEECVDDGLRSEFPAEEAIPVIKLGLICASQVPSSRPDMEEVINILELIRCPSGQEEVE